MLVLLLFLSEFSQLRKYKTLPSVHIIRSTLKAIILERFWFGFVWSYIQLFSQYVGCIERFVFIFNVKISKPVRFAFMSFN